MHCMNYRRVCLQIGGDTLMRFRHFNVVLSEDFEVSLLIKIINDYINNVQVSGGTCTDICMLKDKLLSNSVMRDISVDSPFDNY